MTPPRWRRIGQFYAVALAGIAFIAAVLYALDARGLVTTGLSAVAMFSPMLATVVVHRLDGRPAFDGLAVPAFNRWLFVAMSLPVLASFAIVALGALLPGASLDLTLAGVIDRLPGQLGPDQMGQVREQLEAIPGGVPGLAVLSIPQVVILGLTLNAVFAFGEEVGWRGWLDRELGSYGFWKRNLLIGMLWGFWHAPLILNGHNYPVHRVEGVLLFTLVCTAMAPVLGFVRERGGSVWHAAVFHGVINASAGLSLLMVAGSDLVVGVPGLAGLLVYGALSAGLLWMRPREPQEPTV